MPPCPSLWADLEIRLQDFHKLWFTFSWCCCSCIKIWFWNSASCSAVWFLSSVSIFCMSEQLAWLCSRLLCSLLSCTLEETSWKTRARDGLEQGFPAGTSAAMWRGSIPITSSHTRNWNSPQHQGNQERFRARHFGSANQGAESLVHSSEFTFLPATLRVFSFSPFSFDIQAPGSNK